VAKRLDAERLDLWRQLRRTTASIAEAVADDLEADLGIELATFELLSALEGAGGRCRMQELASLLVVNRSTLTRMVDRLDNRGLVLRELTTTDGRGVYAVLTKKGQRAYLKARPVYRRSLQREFARRLTESDVMALHRVLNKMTDPSV
jgi:DNA-binding MarR family transcriptional regulator